MGIPSSSRSRFGKALFAAVVLATAALHADEKIRASLGVLRPDGIVIPFASFDNGSWSVPWPGTTTGFMLPLTIDDIPKGWWGAVEPATPWKAWMTGGDTRDLKLQRPIQIPIFCSLHLGLATDYRGKLPAEPMPTLPKDGLAVAGNVTPGPIQPVSRLAPDVRRVAEMIKEKFDRAEDAAAGSFTQWHHPFNDAQRRALPIELESIYRTVDSTRRGTWTTNYVEAVRKYPARPGDRGCGLITYAYGWVREQEGKPPRIDLGAKVTYCDREGVPFMQPLGRLLLKDEVYWVYQLSSWRDEVYVISRVRPDKVEPVVAVSGGACSRQQMR